MNRTEFREHVEALGMTQGGAARFLDVDVRTVRRFAAKHAKIPRSIDLLLRLMVQHKFTPEQMLKLGGYKLPDEGFHDQRPWMQEED